MSLDPSTFLAAQFADCETAWSLGTFGAVAAFTRESAEPAVVTDDARAISVVTARGGIRIDRHPDIRLVASETALDDSWSHRVAICLPVPACRTSVRTTLTELGFDRDSLRPQDRAAILFDLGLATPQVDICVRAAEPDSIASLRKHVGCQILEPDGSAIEAILRTRLHWVVISRAGRAEVYQPIAGAEPAGGQGPRFHILRKLLALRRTHATTEPIPAGVIPFAHCYPPHPGRDAHGRARPFDHACHAAFQVTLRAFGDPQLNALKQAVVSAVTAARGPESVPIARNRQAFGCIRVALRQLQASGVASATLDDWIAAYFGNSPARRR